MIAMEVLDWLKIRQFATAGMVRRLTEIHSAWQGTDEQQQERAALNRQLDLIQNKWPFGQPPSGS